MTLSRGSYDAVVLYYRRGVEVFDVIRSLLEQTSPPRTIVLVDNGSGDGVLDSAENVRELKTIAPSLLMLVLPENLGYAGGMNAGARYLRSDADYILFATHEVDFDTNCLQYMLGSAHRNSAAVVGPALTLNGSKVVWSLGGIITRWGSTRHICSGDDSNDNHERTVDWVDGSVLLADREVFEEIGGFDERYFLYWEDVDICSRAARLGPVLVSERAKAGQDTGLTPPYYQARNRIMYWRLRRAYIRLLIAVFSQIRPLASSSRQRQLFLARLSGTVHGLVGRLDREQGKVRMNPAPEATHTMRPIEGPTLRESDS